MKVIVTILLLSFLQAANARMIRIGAQRPVKTLREGIRLASDGDTLLLEKGIYKEHNNVISKRICLIGLGDPVLDGENKFEILTLTGGNIRIRGIHFINAGYSSLNDFAALKVVDASNVIIENNRIDNAAFAIHISNSTNSIIRNNVIAGNNKSEHLAGNGIHLWKCSGMTIGNNRIRGHRDGIYFEFVTDSKILGNDSEWNIRYGLHFMFSHNDNYLDNTFRNNGAGVAVMYSHNVHMQNNLFENNWGASAYGLLLKDISASSILHNRFIGNTVAIHMEGSSRMEFASNIFRSNGWALKVQASCDDNTFHHNNFSSNSFDVATNGTMMLNKFYNNYWDRYEGYDLNKDGIGDVPYHPVSMYSMVIEQNPATVILMRSFMVTLLDKAEKAIPTLTPEKLVDNTPLIKPVK